MIREREGISVPKFLIKASYTVEGLRGLQKDKASGREKAIAAAIEAAGGKLEGLWYGIGEEAHVYALVDVPSIVVCAAFHVKLGASGLATNSTTALLTVAEMDKALSEDIAYRMPGT
jgi:uncharacterized protein with GYD domain